MMKKLIIEDEGASDETKRRVLSLFMQYKYFYSKINDDHKALSKLFTAIRNSLKE